jgi:hypothetical protein
MSLYQVQPDAQEDAAADRGHGLQEQARHHRVPIPQGEGGSTKWHTVHGGKRAFVGVGSVDALVRVVFRWGCTTVAR